MSVAAVHRQYGLADEFCATAPARRLVTPEHVRFVAANRHRMGWQTMANICGVNRTDLQNAFERGYADAPARPADKKPLPASGRRSPSDTLQVLAAIRRGAVGLEDIGNLCRIGRSHAGKLIKQLKAEGLLAGHGRSGWIITGAGQAALRKGGAHV